MKQIIQEISSIFEKLSNNMDIFWIQTYTLHDD